MEENPQLYQMDPCQHFLFKYLSLAKISRCSTYTEFYSATLLAKNQVGKCWFLVLKKKGKLTHSKAFTLFYNVLVNTFFYDKTPKIQNMCRVLYNLIRRQSL